MSWWSKVKNTAKDYGIYSLIGGPIGGAYAVGKNLIGLPGLEDLNISNPLKGFGGSDYLANLPIVGDQINAQNNLQLQREVFEYQKGLQERIFSREDNSVQRRVNDLKAAGLSPVLAAGQGAGTGATVSTVTPQRQNTSIGIEAIMSMLKMKQDISRTVAEERLINQQANESVSRQILNNQNSGLVNQKTIREQIDIALAKKYGTHSVPSSLVKTIIEMFEAFDAGERQHQKREKVDRAGRRKFTPAELKAQEVLIDQILSKPKSNFVERSK